MSSEAWIWIFAAVPVAAVAVGAIIALVRWIWKLSAWKRDLDKLKDDVAEIKEQLELRSKESTNQSEGLHRVEEIKDMISQVLDRLD